LVFCRWPPQIDVDRASRQLWQAYEEDRALPMQMLGLLNPELVTPQLLAKRLNCLRRERVEWLMEAHKGDFR
jgi:hypothetical protein